MKIDMKTIGEVKVITNSRCRASPPGRPVWTAADLRGRGRRAVRDATRARLAARLAAVEAEIARLKAGAAEGGGA